MFKRTLIRIIMVIALAQSLPAQEADLARTLDSAASAYYLPGVRAAFGTFTYEFSDLPTPFSRWLEDRLLLAASKTSRVTVLNRNAAAALDPVLKDTYGAFLRETGADALLSGRYFMEGERVRVRIELTELSSGTLIGAGDWVAPLASIPDYASVRPSSSATERAKELSSLSGAPAGGLSVSVSTDRGSGGAYRSGESLAILVGVNKDAYVRIYHVDSSGRLQLIWPNRFGGGDGKITAGSPVRLPPDASSPYAFVMEPPFGTEFIKAIASTVPFADSQSDFSDLGSGARGIVTRGLAVTSTSSTKIEVAESLASYYIGP